MNGIFARHRSAEILVQHRLPRRKRGGSCSELRSNSSGPTIRGVPGLALLATVIIGVIGTSAFNILPLLMDGAARNLGFSDQQVGILSLAISLGSGASALFSITWVRSASWPCAAAICSGGMLVSYALSSVLQDYRSFVLLQGSAGIFGGSLLSLAYTILSDRDEPARGFGLATAAQVVYQIFGLVAGPTLLQRAGLSGLMYVLVTLCAITTLVASQLPKQGRVLRRGLSVDAILTPAGLISLAACSAFFVNVGAYWTYLDIMGRSVGLSSSAVANSIAAGVSVGVFGGGFAWFLGDRYGQIRPLGVATLITTASALLLWGPFTLQAFVLSTLLYCFAWNYAVNYQLAVVNSVDNSGQAVAVATAFYYFGAAIGSALAGFLVRPGAYDAIVWLVILAVCISTALFSVSVMIHRYESHLPERNQRIQ